MTSYGLLIFEGAEELDFVALGGIHRLLDAPRRCRPCDAHRPRTRPRAVRQGDAGASDYCTDDHPRLDVLLVPGGQGTHREVGNPSLISWIGRVSASASWVTSVCTGALLLHEAGPARGRRVATHHAFEDTLAARDAVTVVRDARYVVDGNLVTSQGVSAGIDMALWLVAGSTDVITPGRSAATSSTSPRPPISPTTLRPTSTLAASLWPASLWLGSLRAPSLRPAGPQITSPTASWAAAGSGTVLQGPHRFQQRPPPGQGRPRPPVRASGHPASAGRARAQRPWQRPGRRPPPGPAWTAPDQAAGRGAASRRSRAATAAPTAAGVVASGPASCPPSSGRARSPAGPRHPDPAAV